MFDNWATWIQHFQLGLVVTSSTPADGSIVYGTPPTNYVINFSDPIAPASLSPGVLVVNGKPATGDSLSADHKTATFTFTVNPVTSQGLQTMAIAANAVYQDGDPTSGNAAFNATFHYALQPLLVSSTSPAAGSTLLLPGPFTINVTYNQAVDPASVKTSDLVLSGAPGGVVTSATVLPGNTTVRFTLDGFTTDGPLSLEIPAGAITDAFGDPGPAFSTSYVVDFGTLPYPVPLTPKAPLGSLIYDPVKAGVIETPVDVENYTISADPGQTITVLVTPGGTLQPTITLSGKGGKEASASAPSPGSRAFLQTYRVPGKLAGEGPGPRVYTVTVGGASGTTGAFTARITLNAALSDTYNQVDNGGFETGNFDGWTANTTGTPFIPWNVSKSGAGTGFGMAPTSPQDGLYDAWNGFDGTAGTQYTLTQDVTVPAGVPSAELFWKDRVQWNFALTSTATQPRTYNVEVVDPKTNAVLATLETASTGIAYVIGDTGWQTHTADLSAYAGSTVRLLFVENIPETFTGPGQLELDSIQLVVNPHNTVATAQDISGSFINFQNANNNGNGSKPQRGAVLGSLETVSTLPTTTVFYAPFEDASGNFASDGFTVNNTPLNPGYATGLWHPSQGRGSQPGHSPTWSFYYGQGEGPNGGGNYETGSQPNGGYLVSPSITLPKDSIDTLGFNYVLQTENSSFFDRAQVQVNDGSGWTTVSSYNGTAESSTWKAASPVDLSAYAGKSVQLRWYFDTLDPILNNFEGWYVDDVKVQATPLHDDYSFALGSGDSVTIGVTALSPGGNADVSLLNASGNVVATSQAGPLNDTQAIINFVAPASGTYYLQVGGRPGTDYSVVATRNADFSLTPNSTIATAQPVLAPQEAGSQWVLGYVDSAAQVTLAATDSGWYDSFGEHSSFNKNYITGYEFGTIYHDYFVFDESNLARTVLDAKLQAFNPDGGFFSDKPTETYSLFDVTTPLSQLEADNFGRTDIFNDLGSGTSYGSQTVSSADNGKLVTVNLDAAAVSALNAKLGSQVALGGALTTASGPALEILFGFSGSPTDTRQLVLTVAQPNFYKVKVDGNSMLQVDTGIPAYGSGQFVNNLVSGLKLYDPSGNLVATASGSSADGTASMKYKVPKSAGGNYYIEVDALASTKGEYILSIKGASSPSTSTSTASLTAAPITPTSAAAAPAPAIGAAAMTIPTADPTGPTVIPADPVVPVVRNLTSDPTTASTSSNYQAPRNVSAVDQALITLSPPNQDTTDLAWNILLSRKRRSLA